MRYRLLKCAALALSLAFATVAKAATIEHIGLDHPGGASAISFVADAPLAPSIFTLTAPARLVIDFPATQLGADSLSKALRDARIKGLRIGRRAGGALRVVVDLAQPLSADQLVREVEGDRLRLVLGARAAVRDTHPYPSLELAAGQRDIVIAIDPGHGGKDPGTIGLDGVREKDVVLPIARLLKDAIDRQPGFHAVLTRNRNVFIALDERDSIARNARADFFISIHANATSSRSPHGTMVFALSPHGASSEMARWTAEDENHAAIVGNGERLDLAGRSADVRSLLLDLSMEGKTRDSLLAGQSVFNQIAKINQMFSPRVEQANFMVLRAPDIPALLIETDFLSSPEGERRLESGAFRAKLAQAIAAGLIAHFDKLPPAGTLIAWRHGHRAVAS